MTTPPSTEPTNAETPASDANERQDSAAEARKYRQRAQAAEQERDALRNRVERLSRNAVETRVEQNVGQIAGMGMQNVADLWTVGDIRLEDLTDDNGNPDDEKLGAAIDALREERPYLFKQDMLHQALGSHVPSPLGYKPGGGDVGNAWNDAIRGTMTA